MFDAEIIKAIKSHAVREYPREFCGVISAGQYIECENIADNPEEHFRIATEEYTKFLMGQGVQAIVHSHPNGPDCPTKDDMQCQIDTAVPWGIVQVNPSGPSELFFFGDQVPMAPLIGRKFRMGVHDCYSAIRDYLRSEHGVTIPVIPREPYCWEKSHFIADNFAVAGFREIGKLERSGDVVTFRIHADRENHSAVYLGDGLIFEHFPNRLSRRIPIYPWLKYAARYFRHKDMPK